MKTIFKLFLALVYSMFGVHAIGNAVGCDPSPGTTAAIGTGVTVVTGVVHAFTPGVADNTLYGALALKQEWADEMINYFHRMKETWRNAVPREDDWVGLDKINIQVRGDFPTALTDNTTYPLSTYQRTDTTEKVAVHKHETPVAIVTLDELYANPIDKWPSIYEDHIVSLTEKANSYAAFDIAPAAKVAGKQIIVDTQGPTIGTYKSCDHKTLIDLKKALDDAKFPKEGRVLVLNSLHLAELLKNDLAFQNTYQNHADGKPVAKLYGFEIYETGYDIYYTTGASPTKEAYGATPAGTSRLGSFGFIKPMTWQAEGEVIVSQISIEENPRYKQNELSLTFYEACKKRFEVGSTDIKGFFAIRTVDA